MDKSSNGVPDLEAQLNSVIERVDQLGEKLDMVSIKVHTIVENWSEMHETLMGIKKEQDEHRGERSLFKWISTVGISVTLALMAVLAKLYLEK